MEYASLVLVGLLAGVLGGLLGIGGSVVMIPAMVIIFSSHGAGDRIQQYQAAAMIVNFLLIIPAVTRHHHAGAVRWDVWRWVAPAALVGIIAGVAASLLSVFTGDNQKYMKILFGVFLLYVAYKNLRKLLARSAAGSPAATTGSPAATTASPVISRGKCLALGLPMGFSAGLLGIGGGALAVPGLQMLIRLPLRSAIATSAATIMTTAWLGALVKNYGIAATGQGTIIESLKLAACLAPPAMIGAYAGGHLTHKLPLRIVRGVFVALMVVAAVKMLSPAVGLLICRGPGR